MVKKAYISGNTDKFPALFGLLDLSKDAFPLFSYDLSYDLPKNLLLKASPGGKVFTIRPAYWERMVLGFTIVVNGKVVPDHRGEFFDRAKMDDWGRRLEEVTQEHILADSSEEQVLRDKSSPF